MGALEISNFTSVVMTCQSEKAGTTGIVGSGA